MGVPVPVIEKKRVSKNMLERGYGIITTSARIDETAERYEVELDLLISSPRLRPRCGASGARSR